MEGWEVSRDRIEKFQKMLSMDNVGDPIITSKCKLNSINGFIIVSDNGYAWRITGGGPVLAGMSKWIRWHDVANLIETKPGQILVEMKLRKNGLLIADEFSNPKIKKWKLTIKPSKGEPGAQFKQRKQYFYNIMSEIYNRNKVVTDPPTSDSRMVQI